MNPTIFLSKILCFLFLANHLQSVVAVVKVYIPAQAGTQINMADNNNPPTLHMHANIVKKKGEQQHVLLNKDLFGKFNNATYIFFTDLLGNEIGSAQLGLLRTKKAELDFSTGPRIYYTNGHYD